VLSTRLFGDPLRQPRGLPGMPRQLDIVYCVYINEFCRIPRLMKHPVTLKNNHAESNLMSTFSMQFVWKNRYVPEMCLTWTVCGNASQIITSTITNAWFEPASFWISVPGEGITLFIVRTLNTTLSVRDWLYWWAKIISRVIPILYLDEVGTISLIELKRKK